MYGLGAGLYVLLAGVDVLGHSSSSVSKENDIEGCTELDASDVAANGRRC